MTTGPARSERRARGTRAWRLRSLLVGHFLAAMAVALVGFLALVLFWRMPQVQAQIREEQSRVAELALFSLEQSLDNTQEQVRMLAGLRDEPDNGRTFAIATQRLLGSDNLLDGIYLLDGELRLREVYLRAEINVQAEEWLGNDLAGVEVLRRARALRAPQWSGQFLSPIQGRPVVALAQPVPGGFLLAELSMDGLVLLTNQLNRSDGLLVLAVDQQGELVSAPNLRLVRERTNLRHLELVRAALAGAEAHGSFEHDGASYTGTVRRSERLGWGLLVAYPDKVALATRNAALFITLVTLALILLVGIAMSAWLARRVDRLVRGVTDFVQNVAAGRYDGRVPRSGILELRRLGADLEQVARAIGQRERMLAEQDKRFRELVENTADLVIEIDREGRLSYGNPSAREALALGGELLGRPIVELVADADRDRVRRFVTAGALLRHTSYRQDLRMLDGQGGERDISWSTSVDRASDGSLQGYRCIGIDVTAQRAAEAELRELNVRLEDRIAERTHSLRQANAELEQALRTVQMAQERLVQAEKLASLGALVAGVAHELNTPIGNGRMAVSTLRERAREFRQKLAQGIRRSELEGFVAQVEAGGDIALRNLGRASDLLVSFKQVAVDQASDQRRHFKLHEVVDEIMLTLQPSFKRGSHRIESRVPAGIEMDSYPGALGQVLTNLLQNARIHGLEHVLSGLIEIEARVEGGELLLTVADNGQGIPEANHRRVFDPFFTTKLGQGGSGLGLSIVRNIVTGALGGGIGLRNRDSSEGGGVVFEVRVPLVAPQPEPSPAP